MDLSFTAWLQYTDQYTGWLDLAWNIMLNTQIKYSMKGCKWLPELNSQ